MTSASRVLVTGVSGFLGGHVALALLRQGYAVRGSLRDLARADQVRASLRHAGADVSRLEFCALDLMADRGWDAAASGCRFLQHVASPFFLKMPKEEDALIRPAVHGTQRAIRAALAAGHERIVLTSSVAALDGGHPEHGRVLTTADWTDVNGPNVNAYSKAKTLAEQAAWALVDAEGVREKLSVVNPGTLLGPLLDDDPGTSVALIQRLLKGDMPMVPNFVLPYVDVRDVADAQVAAMTAPLAPGRRHIVTNPSRPLPEIARLLRDALPEHAHRIPTRPMPSWLTALVGRFDRSLRDNRARLDAGCRYDDSGGISLLGGALRSTEEALIASAQSLLKRGLA